MTTAQFVLPTHPIDGLGWVQVLVIPNKAAVIMYKSLCGHMLSFILYECLS
jgi:hypothetical protein